MWFEQVYRTLRARIEAFLKLPIDRIRHDGEQLKGEVDRIATLS